MSLSYSDSVKAIVRTTIILSAITIIEVAAVLIYPEGWSIWGIRLGVIVMSITKAYYIVGIFMHMKYEHKDLAYTVLLPITLLFWGVAVFLWEGAWYLHADKTGLVDWMTGW